MLVIAGCSPCANSTLTGTVGALRRTFCNTLTGPALRWMPAAMGGR